MARVHLSLGANTGDRADTLRRAIAALPAAAGGRVVAVSPLYETAPWGVTDQPPFLNLAVALDTRLDPLNLLIELKALEQRAGRVPGPRWGPRPLDIDILLYDDLHLDDPDLVIPHPRMLERRFVLQPLGDIWPAGRPLLGRPLKEWLDAVAEQPVTRRGPLDPPPL